MANHLRLNLADWAKSLAAIPAELAQAANAHVEAAAETAAQQVRAAYPRVTGNLKAGVRVVRRPTGSATRVASTVISGAPHAHLYEYGTVRQRPRPTFYPIVAEAGRALETTLTRLVTAEGYRVTGDID